jgi:DNA-binding transcriptional MerR regulator
MAHGPFSTRSGTGHHALSDRPAPPARLFMTSDVRAATGLSRTHLDFYIREQLVRPVARTESGFLLFDQAEVDLLQEIVDERRAGVPLREIRDRIGR